MSKKKYKGKNTHARRQGLGRLRRASAKSENRVNNWERHVDDDQFLERHGDTHRQQSHTGEHLLAKFNRLARTLESQDGALGTICGFDGQQILVRDERDHEWTCDVRKALTKQMRGVKSPLCVGDHVRWQRQDANDAEHGIIVGVLPRDNQLARADSHNKALLHVLAANVDRVVIVAAVHLPELRCALIDRYLLLAHLDDIEAIIVLNKNDLDAEHELNAVAERYRALGYTCLCTTATDPQATRNNLETLRTALAGSSCVFTGQSGVGKSSLVNALYPEFKARVGAISEAQGKGTHTTTAARAYRVGKDTVLIDTPGIRECAIPGDLEAIDVALLYPDIAAHHHACRFNNCTHSHEPDCAVRAALEAGDIHPERYRSYIDIIDEDIAKS